ncbi:hypothetical protein QWT69_14010 [Sporosarcina oncorhynchi]|uniref:Uncharacterized protein n=1 Tax=Sporosarcina oncorhynchi TaxID=3056444 RepID=A0ABZ0L6I0_9BACL|nr:hypothetical protein [Sporosarcina sp. T2O-4]WOV86974.1 hypothetical protein QWT69_14010 [Sporosarcina sp. T2O-4]
MNKKERQKRLNEILVARKQKDLMQEAIQKENEVKVLLQEVFGETKVFEILDSNKTNSIVEDFSVNFPIGSWNSIDWETTIVNRVEINPQEIKSVPSLLISKGFDTLTPIYIFWGYNSYPCVKTNLTEELLSTIEEIAWLGSDLYIYCLRQKYVIEFFHDNTVTIGWV